MGYNDYWRDVFTIIFYVTKIFMTSSNKCISHSNIFKRKKKEAKATINEIDTVKVALEVNVLRVKNEPRLRI
jgi:hypothetical protein